MRNVYLRAPTCRPRHGLHDDLTLSGDLTLTGSDTAGDLNLQLEADQNATLDFRNNYESRYNHSNMTSKNNSGSGGARCMNFRGPLLGAGGFSGKLPAFAGRATSPSPAINYNVGPSPFAAPNIAPNRGASVGASR